MQNPWQLLDDKNIYSNPWIDVNHHKVIDPSGQPGIYGKVHFKNIAVGVLPLDKENNTWIVGQYRYPLERYSWEIPEGGCPIGTDSLLSAKRELKEETGIVAQNWDVLLETDISNSVTDEIGIIYLARDLSFTEQALESTEDITVRKLPFAQLLQMVVSGDIRDSLTIMAVLNTHLFKI